jgi:hypothetical protein
MAHVMNADLGQAASLNPPRNALRERTPEHRREERQDLDLERPARRLDGGFGGFGDVGARLAFDF